ELADYEKSTMAIFNNAAPSVVYLFTERSVRGFFGTKSTRQGAGSGFLWDKAGHVVTNYHVVAGSQKIQVRLDSGLVSDATFVGASPDHDLAVVRLRNLPPKIVPIPIGESETLKVGQAAFAIGNPYGLDRTLTTGIISALNRRLPAETGREIVGLIQTDAAINPGNSGGPLIDSAGRLIGVNTAIISGSGSSAGIGFAVPVDTVNDIVPKLISHGKVARPGIGISVLSEEDAASLGIVGIVIEKVFKDSEAARAGLRGIDYYNHRLGDIIVAVQGKKVANLAEFLRII
ncbi:MAG: trypsin-like serine protease, partial [bacterium]|nr:trypsin-like serine protease [bacterium]